MKGLLPRVWFWGLACGLVAGCGGTEITDTASSGTTSSAAVDEIPEPPRAPTPMPEGKRLVPASPVGGVPSGAEAREPGAAAAAVVGGSTGSRLLAELAIDAAAVTALVKPAEAVGASSPLPEDDSIYWQMPDPKKIQDEPLVVEVPRGLGELTPVLVVPETNPLTKGKFELGRLLYFDPRISKNGTVSCATCHDPSEGWSKGTPTAIGIDGQAGGRNAPTVINTVYGKSMFWDGRAASLEAQSQGPPRNPIEMGDQSYEEIIMRLRDVPAYREQFAKVFGTDVTLDGVAKAIATFERVAALSGDSAYDRYRDLDAEGHNDALSESAKRGLVLFGERLNDDDEYQPNVVLQKAKCTLCHVGFNFTDEKFHNLGVGYDASTGKFADYGRWAVTAIGAKNLAEIGAFKTPTLRDVARTAPYLHDGSEPTLEAVVELYNKGGVANPYLDKDMQPLNLTESEKADLVAFMKALTGREQAIEIPTLPPSSDGTAPDAKAALQIPARKVADALHGLMVR